MDPRNYQSRINQTINFIMRPGTGPPGFGDVDHLLTTLLRTTDSINNGYKKLGLRYHRLPLAFRQDVIDNIPKEACKAFLLTPDGRPSSMMLRMTDLENAVSAAKIAIRDQDYQEALKHIESGQEIADDLDGTLASLDFYVQIHFAVKSRRDAEGIITHARADQGFTEAARLCDAWARELKETKAALLLGTIRDVDALAFVVGRPRIEVLDGPTEVWVDRANPREQAANARTAAERDSKEDEVEVHHEEFSEAELELRRVAGPLAAVEFM